MNLSAAMEAMVKDGASTKQSTWGANVWIQYLPLRIGDDDHTIPIDAGKGYFLCTLGPLSGATYRNRYYFTAQDVAATWLKVSK
jgi:hypothetical protein